MELRNRRESDRFKRPLFVQFRQQKGLSAYSLGMTVNISRDGFCFQFQDIELENLENLEFSLNKPQTNQSVQFFGDVMWIQKKDAKCTAGIKFRMTDKKSRKEMLNIISEFFTIPANLLRYNQRSKRSTINKRYTIEAPKPDDVQRNESSPGTQIIKRGMKICLNLLMITVITIAFVLFLPVITERYENVKKPFAPHIHTAVYDNSNIDPSRSISKVQIQDEIVNSHFEPEREFVAEENKEEEFIEESIKLIEQENKVDLIQPLTKPARPENFKFYIQVASLRNPDIAYNMLLKIKNYYPEAYLFKINNFYKIRIPGINTEKQGAEIIKEIEEKLGIESILVYRLN